ncbi:sulfite reductase flavoprotein subunit alpha [Acidipila sp. EB88]|uniref:diflavin oxidoreductase n=1 Tax=Acidipila sp. EB88 TaxID=2305226 RepID=UPI000F5E1D81|nr:flavodoxin domain-containing protein [Acidipila sp. EB88]RRA49606.1 sulfite reductase subunit alpha [Acidipila sp. EB88]
MTTATVPFIPDNAPFSTEQRAWLNGFLAGLFSQAPAQQPAPSPALSLTVLYATQGGTAERLAKKVAKELKAKGHTTELFSLEDMPPATLADKEHALILASTYGEGDPPDACRRFADAMSAPDAPRMEKLRYSVFALGDHSYEHFCKFGVDLDERLAALGAERLMPRVESGVDVDAPFDQWKSSLSSRLAERVAGSSGKSAPASMVATATSAVAPGVGAAKIEPLHTRDHPFLAPLRARTPLTSGHSSKVTMHLAFDIEDAQIEYAAGDSCGVVPTNDPVLVADILEALAFDAGASIALPKVGEVSMEQALLHHLQPTRLTRKIVQAFASKSGSKTLTALLPAEQSAHLESFMYDRGLIDLLLEYPGLITEPAEIAAMLPRLSPRLYSISSSPAAHGREVHTTVAVVRYKAHGRERGGICSTLLADRTGVGARLPIYIQANPKFRIPENNHTPIIMVGPGTGIAPFRSFLYERRALGASGKNWLFFGERSASTDFLYCEELRAMAADGHLTRLDTAFSRDQEHKIYVQDRMLERGAELWHWLGEGAVFYVCGDASRMAKDVDAALHTVVEQHGGMDRDAAREYISQLHDEHRYHRDVY